MGMAFDRIVSVPGQCSYHFVLLCLIKVNSFNNLGGSSLSVACFGVSFGDVLTLRMGI